jgi:hypothetical protein
MSFLGMFLLGVFITWLIKKNKGKKITAGRLIFWGLLFAVFFPAIAAILTLVFGLAWAVAVGFLFLGFIAIMLILILAIVGAAV